MPISTIEQRRDIYLRSLAWLDGVLLSADRATFATDLGAGGVIAALSEPFGPGATLAVVGAPSPQLALAGGRIVAGAAAAVAGETYRIKIRVTSADGEREVAETLRFLARLPVVLPPDPPAPAPIEIEGTLADAIRGTPYSAALAIEGGTGPFTITLKGAPAGLSAVTAGRTIIFSWDDPR